MTLKLLILSSILRRSVLKKDGTYVLGRSMISPQYLGLVRKVISDNTWLLVKRLGQDSYVKILSISW